MKVSKFQNLKDFETCKLDKQTPIYTHLLKIIPFSSFIETTSPVVNK